MACWRGGPTGRSSRLGRGHQYQMLLFLLDSGVLPTPGGAMTETQTLNRLRRRHWHALNDLLRDAYRHGFEAGKARARGLGRRGRTIRADATVAGLVDRIQSHF